MDSPEIETREYEETANHPRQVPGVVSGPTMKEELGAEEAAEHLDSVQELASPQEVEEPETEESPETPAADLTPGGPSAGAQEDGQEAPAPETAEEGGPPPDGAQPMRKYRSRYSEMLLSSKNLIFRGAPGTGKSYLARSIAADIISDGLFDDYSRLSEEQKQQVEFVQFHPSYDYTDFVEGLRPRLNEDGTMGFELQDGVFKRFVARARKNFEDSRKPLETIEREVSVQEAMTDFFESIVLEGKKFETVNRTQFEITSVTDSRINIAIPGNATTNRLALNKDELRRMLESGKEFRQVRDVTEFFGRRHATQGYSYDFVLFQEIRRHMAEMGVVTARAEGVKKYVFIIDEINRGEISKIFGELFFAIDPGYRGKAGEISTQYSNMHGDPDEKFYIPENVYIIGTMNDIDRSVDSFDFAMRRRFRFVEIRADQQLKMLDSLGDRALKAEAIRRLKALNQAIVEVEDLNENYQIGPSYFLKLKELDFDQLWTDCLQPLLQDYVQGMYDEKGIMKRFAAAYGYGKRSGGQSA